MVVAGKKLTSKPFIKNDINFAINSKWGKSSLLVFKYSNLNDADKNLIDKFIQNNCNESLYARRSEIFDKIIKKVVNEY